MPAIIVPIGAFQAVYVGNFGATSILTKVTDFRSEGSEVTDDVETEYTPLLDAREQVGNHMVQAMLTFIDSPMSTRLAKGLSIAATPQSPPGTGKYQLFLVNPRYDDQLSYYFSGISTITKATVSYTKGGVSYLKVTFIAENRDVNYGIVVKDTVANCLTAMGPLLAPFTYP